MRIDYKAMTDTWAAEAADLWASVANRRAMSGIFSPLYLYVRPTGDATWATEDETPDTTWTLAWQQGFRGSMTRDQVKNLIRTFAGRLPIAAWCDSRHAAQIGGAR